MLNIRKKIRLILFQQLFYSVIMMWIRRNLITKDELLAQTKIKNNLYIFGSQESIDFEKPINFHYNLHKCKWVHKVSKVKDIYTTTISRPYVCVLESVELIGTDALGVTRENKIIFETVGSRMNCLELTILKSLNDFHFKDIQFMQNPPTIDLAFSLVFPMRGYFHWWLDSLIRIQAFEYYCKETDKNPTIIIPPKLSKWMSESLKLVGYDKNNCIIWNQKRIKINQLVLPCFYRYQPNPTTSPAACYWLRNRVLGNIEKQKDPSKITNSFLSKNILISRRKAKSRRIVNEDELIKKLSPLKFTCYILEDMSVSEQVKLFSQAEVIIAPHGAGLTNIIFSKNATIIELFGSRVPLFYFTLAKGLKLQYFPLRCQVEGEDMKVNQNQLNEIIKIVNGLQKF